MTFEIDENIPEKPSLRPVQTINYGIPKDKQYKVVFLTYLLNFETNLFIGISFILRYFCILQLPNSALPL